METKVLTVDELVNKKPVYVDEALSNGLVSSRGRAARWQPDENENYKVVDARVDFEDIQTPTEYAQQYFDGGTLVTIPAGVNKRVAYYFMTESGKDIPMLSLTLNEENVFVDGTKKTKVKDLQNLYMSMKGKTVKIKLLAIDTVSYSAQRLAREKKNAETSGNTLRTGYQSPRFQIEVLAAE